MIFVGVILCLVIVVDSSPLVNPGGADDDKQDGILDTIIKVNKDNDVINLYEGDIALSLRDNVDLRETGDVDGPLPGSQIAKKNAVRSREVLWKNKIVPYEIQVPADYKPTINAAIDEFHKKTCIRFVPRTNEKHWIRFIQSRGCWSSVGMKYWQVNKGQDLSLGRGCNHKGIIMHELLHALGFWHEQSRPDRNQYVEVLWENIRAGREHNFNKYSHGRIDTLKRAYDMNSIMHYGNKAFSKNGKPTLLGIGQNKNKKLGQRNGFTATDIFEVNALYDCKGSSSKGWSSWSGYGPCYSNCKKIRQRFCTSINKTECPGANKHGIQNQYKVCPASECYAPVDGHWGRWSSWSQCSVTCGSGSHTRTRLCNDPQPKNGGKACVGSNKGTGKCEQRRCGLGRDDCEFEVDACMWSQENPRNAYRWYRQSGKTTSQDTGPNGDVSINKGGKGIYVYAEASSPVKAGQVAKLQSKVLPSVPNGRCIQFAYSMYGSGIGALNVYVIDAKNGAKSKIFSKSGDQGQGWRKTNATIDSMHDYKISFEATRGKSYTGDIALDDIMFKDGRCDRNGPTTTKPTTTRPTTTKPTTTRPTTTRPTTTRPTTTKPTTTRPTTTKPTTTRTTTTRPTTTRPTTTRPTTTRPTTTKPTTTRPTTTRPTTTKPTTTKPTTTKPTTTRPVTTVSPAGISLDCDFDRDMCQWKSRKGTNKYKWARHKYTTKSSNTGPDGDNTSGYGHYVYMETSKQNGQGQTAYLKSPALPPSDAHCLTFYYHMYGRDMGSLNVYIQKPKSRKKFLVFTVSGDQGDMWHYQEVAIASTCKYRVVFEGVRGTSFLSDIALDDILFNDGPCY